MAPLVDFRVDWDRLCSPWMLGDGDESTTLIHVLDDPVRIKSLVGDEAVEFDAVDQRGKANGVATLARQENEAHEIAKRIGQGEDFGGPAALRLADGLILSPPLAPCP